MLAALLLLIAPVVILTVGHSPHANGANTITVNTLLDPGSTGDHLCGLREAIANANAEADTTMGDCAAGTGNDTIVFSLSGTIALASGLPSIQHTLEIDGTGQTITVDGGGASRVFLNFSGALTLNNLTIANGHSTGNGGGVFNNGPLTVINSTFVGNSAAAGGAISNSEIGVLTVTNCTFSGNVGTGGGGGAIFTNNGGTISSSTFSGNSGGSTGATGAAIFGNGSTVEVSNSILANSIGLNCPVQDVEVIGNGGDNISDDGSCGFGSSIGANGDTIGDDVVPLLDTNGLQNNGGPTDTIALQPNSPAVNGVPIANCPATDQRGDPRPDPGDTSGTCDIGAFESIDALGSPTPTASATPTGTATATFSASPTATMTASPTPTATVTTTATPTATATPTVSATTTATTTDTPTATATVTSTATDTPTVTGTPTETPTPTATITITPTASPTPKPPPVKLTITPASLNFGSVKTGGMPIKSITLHNKSKTIDAITVPQVTGQFFSLASNDCVAGVPAGGTCKIGVSFAPSAKGKKFTGNLTFTDQSKKSGHKIALKGKGVSTPASTLTPTPSATATPTGTATSTATATPTITSTSGATPSATATATPSPTGTSTATYTLTSISETVSGFVDLNNPGATPNPVETMQAVAVSTPSFTDSISVSDTNVDISGSASASQTSQADGATISADESAAASADLSLCPGASPLCTAENQGITEFEADFCIASDTTYSLTGSVQASPNEDIGNITATGVVSIETVGPSPMLIVNEQASNGQDVPISMSVPLTAGCYDITIEVFADALPSGTGAGSASSSCNVLLSPQ